MEAARISTVSRACAAALKGACALAAAAPLALVSFSTPAQQTDAADAARQTDSADAPRRTARADEGTAREKASHPTPRRADGSVDLGGDGIWQLPWITDFGKVLVGRNDIPFLPWTKAMYDYNQATNVAYDPEGFCLPPGGPRAFGTPYPAQFIQEPDRIVVIFEGGAHVWREIHMDGRPLPDPNDITPTYFGYSVGHWDGDTLVIDTVGFNEKSWLNFGGYMHTDQMRTVERISRPNLETLHYEATIDDPGAYSEPWTIAWDIPWTAGQDLAEYICQENNQFLLTLKDDFGKPFFQDEPVSLKDAFAK